MLVKLTFYASSNTPFTPKKCSNYARFSKWRYFGSRKCFVLFQAKRTNSGIMYAYHQLNKVKSASLRFVCKIALVVRTVTWRCPGDSQTRAQFCQNREDGVVLADASAILFEQAREQPLKVNRWPAVSSSKLQRWFSQTQKQIITMLLNSKI